MAEAQEDPFASQPDADDPFAGQDDGGATPPVVDKEGNPVQPETPAAAPVQPEPVEAVPDPPAQEPPAPEQPDPAPEAAAPAAAPPAPPEPPQQPSAPASPESGNKSPLRKYRLIYQTGETQWTEAEWTPEGEDTPTRVLEARNNEHATRLAWGILGRPENGVTVLPIPDSSWKPKRLKAATVPVRESLVIS